MKYKRIILLLICAWFVSCSGGVDNETENPDDQTDDSDDQKNEIDSLAFWELLPGGTITAIECTIDSIELKFCLLNENGIAATKFKEGENFYFYFKMTNHSIDSLCVYDINSGLYCNRGLGDIKTLDNNTIKNPVMRYCDVSYQTYPFYGENSNVEMILPWDDDYDHNPESEYYVPEVHIPKGKYYTQITHIFKYVLHDHTPIISFGPLTFKIYFEIE